MFKKIISVSIFSLFITNPSNVSASTFSDSRFHDEGRQILGNSSRKIITMKRIYADINQWDDVRGKMFDFTPVPENGITPPERTPMNSANLSPTFLSIETDIVAFMRKSNSDVDMEGRIEDYDEIVGSARQALSTQIGVNESIGRIAFVRNASEANNIINNCFIIDDTAQKNILLWDENHGTNGKDIWEARMAEQGLEGIVTVNTFNLSGVSWDIDSIIARVTAQIDSETALVSFTEFSNVTGTLLPATELCTAIKGINNNIFIHVDGAQSLGSLDLNLDNMGCDSFSASCHKWFCGPRETGILYIKTDQMNNFRLPHIVGYDGYIEFNLDDLPNDATRFEQLGQRNDPNLLALWATVDVHNMLNAVSVDFEGGNSIQERVRFLGSELYNSLSENSFQVVTPANEDFRLGAIVMDLETAEDATNAYTALRNNAIDISRSGDTGLRLCTHIYNTSNDIDQVVEILNSSNVNSKINRRKSHGHHKTHSRL